MTTQMTGNTASAEGHTDYLKFVDYAPAIIDFINANPNNIFAKLLATLAGFLFHDGKAEFPPVEEELKPQLAQKAVGKIDPTAAAKAYMDSIGNSDKPFADAIKVHYAGSPAEISMTLKKSVNDPDTGFKGAIYQDASGHSIVFYGGMDMLRGVDMKDVEAIAQTRLMKNGVNQQVGSAQDLYLQAVKMSTSTEVVGYSLGAMLANDTAARLGAKATTIADIGLPDVKNTDGKSMYTEENLQSVRDNVTVLKMQNDAYAGKAGPVYGHVINLPSVAGNEITAAIGPTGLPENFNSQVTLTAHHPMAYVLGSEKLAASETAPAIASAAPAPVTVKAAGLIG